VRSLIFKHGKINFAEVVEQICERLRFVEDAYHSCRRVSTHAEIPKRGGQQAHRIVGQESSGLREFALKE